LIDGAVPVTIIVVCLLPNRRIQVGDLSVVGQPVKAIITKTRLPEGVIADLIVVRDVRVLLSQVSVVVAAAVRIDDCAAVPTRIIRGRALANLR
jgi:hypothetical protein